MKANLDYWIEGDHTRADRTVSTAEIHGPGGEFLRSVSAEGPANSTDLASDVCILDLQNQLALGILDALSVEDKMTRFVTPCETCPRIAARRCCFNNEAVQLALDDDLYRAELLLRDALSLAHPAYSDAHSNLGWVLRRQDDLTGAIEAYETAVELNTFNPLGHFNLGLAYELDGRLTESIDEYQSAIDLDPAFYQAFNNMGFTYLQMGQLDRAEQALNERSPN